MSPRVNVDQLLAELERAARGAGFATETWGDAETRPLLGFTRRGTGPDGARRRIYLSAGIHGDEPAGPLAVLRLLEQNALPPHHDYFLCPLLNPNGLETGTRENRDGIDLNRDYTAFRSNEIRAHREWLAARVRALDLSLHLHEDWEMAGFYLYELNFGDSPGPARAMLEAAGAAVPLETAGEIDGHPAEGAIIRPEKIPDVPEGKPEAVYLSEQCGGLNYTLETPSGLPLDDRIDAHRAAVLASLG